MKSPYSKEYDNLSKPKSLKQNVKISGNQPQNVMSTETKDFIKKICYRKTASVDMTQYGFIKDRKKHLVTLLMKPLKERLENMCGKQPTQTKASVPRKKPVRMKVKLRSQPVPLATQSSPSPPRRVLPRSSRPTLRSPGTPTSLSGVRRVRIVPAKPYNRK